MGNALRFSNATVGAFAALVGSIAYGLAQEPNLPPSLTSTDRISAVPLLSSQELLFSLCVLLFGCFVIFIEYRLLSKLAVAADEVLRVLTVTMMIVVSLALVSSGFGKEQISPVLALFGTIIGYLLGASVHGPKKPQAMYGETK
jgi:hypothetical protein